MAGNADDSMKPAQKLSAAVSGSDTYGRARLNGAVPRIDSHITGLRP